MTKVYVDRDNDNINEWAYLDQHGEEESVIINETGECVDIKSSEGGEVTMFTQDIPKLILALQAAYDSVN